MVNLATETNLDVLRQAVVLLEIENRRPHDRLQLLCKELAVWRGDSPDKLQLELIKLQELVNQRNHELFGDKERASGDADASRRIRRRQGRASTWPRTDEAARAARHPQDP